MAPLPAFHSLDLNSTLGAPFIGTLVAMCLYGVLTMQTYIYFGINPSDSKWLKSLVTSLWVLNTVHIMMLSALMYYYLVTNYANPVVLLSSIWLIQLHPLINAFIPWLVQMFYARQIWGLSKGNYYITVAIIALTFLQFGLSATLTAKAFSLDVLEYLMGKEIEWMAAVCLAATLACNLLITASLCYYLYINKTGFDVTDSFINSLMLYSLTTGFLTSTCALINLVLFVSMPTKIVSYAANFTMAKLYTISVLTMLNHRDKCRLKLSQNVTPQTFHLGPLKFEGNETPNKTNHVTIHMTHETEVRSDFDHMISVTTDDSRSE